MRISLAAGAAAAILSLSSRGPIAFAQAPAPTLSSVKAGTYKVESYHTQVGFITGNLTLHGVTKPVVLHARLVGAGVNPLEKGYTVGFEAAGTIKRSNFGVTTYLPAVGDDVQLTIAGAFELKR